MQAYTFPTIILAICGLLLAFYCELYPCASVLAINGFLLGFDCELSQCEVHSAHQKL